MSNALTIFSALPPVLIAAATTLLGTQSTSNCWITLRGGAYTVTLPSPTIAGLRFEIINLTIAGGSIITIDAGAGLLRGSWAGFGAGITSTTASQYIRFLAAATEGDKAVLISNGTQWTVYAVSGVAAGFQFA